MCWICSSPPFLINCVKVIAIANYTDFCCSFAFMVANNEPGIREKNDIIKWTKNISITMYPISYPLSIDLFALFYPPRTNKNIKTSMHSLRMSYWPNSVFVFMFLLFANGTQFPTNTRTHKLNTNDEKLPNKNAINTMAVRFNKFSNFFCFRLNLCSIAKHTGNLRL